MSTGTPATDELVGQILASRYEILHKLGEGAMGAVYKARHIKVGRLFAVKVLHARLLQDGKLARRFEREAELAGRLHHANVVGVVDVGEVDGMHYMVMDFAEGPDLARLLREAPMPAARIIHLVRQLLEGLFHAHEQGVIHRDFKPENVIVERDLHGGEIPRIVDFGIALLRETGAGAGGRDRLTTGGLVLGTPHYMAPEQAVADPIDHRIDLFALGIVIYEMLSGRLPFDGHGADVARANLMLDPPPILQRVPYLEVDPLLEAFARRLMAKKREARPATAKAARELLDLIERDRLAAAVALGLPAELSLRGHAATLQVPAQADPDVPAPSAAPAPSPPAPPGWVQAPAPPSPPAPYVDAPLRARQDSTDLRSPLGWPPEPAPRRRRRWLIGGLAVGCAGVAAAVLLATSGRAQAPVPEETRVVMQPAGPDVPAPAAAPAPSQPAAPADAAPPEPAGSGSMADPPDAPAGDDSLRAPASARPPGPPPRKGTGAPPRPPARPRGEPAATPDPPRKPASAPPPTSITAAQLSALYYRIPPELGRVPKDRADELWSQFRRFDIQALMAAPQATRDEAAARLSQLLQRASQLAGR